MTIFANIKLVRTIRKTFCSISLSAALLATCSYTSAATLITLASFTEATTGKEPRAELVFDPAGNLYGMANRGGANNEGTLFKFDTGTNTLSAPASFDGTTTGSRPDSALMSDGTGNLYGTVFSGGSGAGSPGTVIKFNTGTNTLTTLASMNFVNFGAKPMSTFVGNGSGYLYGTAPFGVGGDGGVFKLNLSTNALSLVAPFNASSGGVGFPYGSLALGNDGNFYGAGYVSGASGNGGIYKVNPVTNTLTTIASFNDIDGSGPQSRMVADAAGNFYGTTLFGGGFNNNGTVFKFDPTTNTITSLFQFDSTTTGSFPQGDLIIDAAGNLFGTNSGSSPGYSGSVFRIDAVTHAMTTVWEFNAPDGLNPIGGVIADAQGNLYGTTALGGANGDGTIFKLTDTGFVVIPEPSSLVLLGVVGCALLYCRRRKSSV